MKLSLLHFIRWLILIIGITLLYFFLAKFGMAWSSFTSNITLVWPAAGLALFCFFHFGWRVAPAIFLGSFLATQILHFNQTLTPSSTIIFLAMVMALADTAQALLIATLNKALMKTHFNQSILRLLPFLVSVFVGCFISSSIGTLVLHHLHIVTSDELYKSWLFWWMGDSAGMLLFAPLLLWIFTKKLRTQNPKARAFLLLSSVVGISIFVMVAISYMERTQTKQQQDLAAHRFQTALENQLELSLRDMDVMNRFYYKIYPTEKDFTELAQPLLERSPWIDRLTWLPVKNLKANQPSEFWSFSLHHTQPQSIAHYIQLIKSNPEYKQLFVSNIQFTEKNNFDLLYLFHPVMDCINSSQEKCYFRGWIIADIDITQWLNYALEQTVKNSSIINILLKNNNQQLSAVRQSGHWLQQDISGSATVLLETPWNLLNQSWQLTIFQENGVEFNLNWIQVVALICCLLVVSLLMAYVHAQQKNDDLSAINQQKLQEDIDLHTESLREANNWLLKEIADRKSTQDLLEKSQHELFQREQHLRSLLDNIPDPVWLKSVEGLYLSCNKSFAAFLGLPESEIIGKHENELVSAETANDFKINDEKALNNNHQPHRYEQWLLSPDGEKYLLDTLKVGIKNLEGDVIGVLGIARDVTEKHQLISALQSARDAADEATQSKSRFLANMSHEIRTPLNAVLGYAQLLFRDKEISLKQQEKLSAILTSGHKLLGLINDILDLSKIESGALNIKEDYFDLHQEMSTVITVIADRARAKNLPVLTHFALPKPFIVKSDRQKLGQILINLLSNAIKFTNQGQINVELLPTDSGIEFIVTDTGTGIVEKELSELFVAFKQGIAGEHAGGTGLGLTLSRHLAEAMGGSLQLQSQVGVGTKAFLHLPLKEEIVQLVDDEFVNVKSISLSKSVNILVVEDDLASNAILVDLLLQTGCRVASAANGREGLEKAIEENFDIIFTDIRMPDLNGLEMLQALRQQPTYKSTPIIAVSASSLEHEREYYLAQGFHDFIGKPYAFDEIYKALIKFVGAQYAENPSENIVDVVDSSIEHIDFNKVSAELKTLLTYATQGDMSNTKSIIATLNVDAIGKHNHQQLMLALKHYDLEKVEALVKSWLESLVK